MVSFVIVSHSAKLAEGVVDLTKMTAPEARVFCTGGLLDGSYGTCYEDVLASIKAAHTEDGVVVLFDIGSAAMTAEMATEELGLERIKVVDCPVVEGSVLGTVLASAGADFEEIVRELENLNSNDVN